MRGRNIKKAGITIHPVFRIRDSSPVCSAFLDPIGSMVNGSIDDIAKLAGIGSTRTNQIITDLKYLGKIERVGGNKKGYWKVY